MEWFGLKGTLKIIWFQFLCHGQGHLPPAQLAQSSIQPGLEHCQGGGSHSFSGEHFVSSHKSLCLCVKDASPQKLPRKVRMQRSWHGMQEKFPLSIYQSQATSTSYCCLDNQNHAQAPVKPAVIAAGTGVQYQGIGCEICPRRPARHPHQMVFIPSSGKNLTRNWPSC